MTTLVAQTMVCNSSLGEHEVEIRLRVHGELENSTASQRESSASVIKNKARLVIILDIDLR